MMLRHLVSVRGPKPLEIRSALATVLLEAGDLKDAEMHAAGSRDGSNPKTRQSSRPSSSCCWQRGEPRKRSPSSTPTVSARHWISSGLLTRQALPG